MEKIMLYLEVIPARYGAAEFPRVADMNKAGSIKLAFFSYNVLP